MSHIKGDEALAKIASIRENQLDQAAGPNDLLKLAEYTQQKIAGMGTAADDLLELGENMLKEAENVITIGQAMMATAEEEAAQFEELVS